MTHWLNANLTFTCRPEVKAPPTPSKPSVCPHFLPPKQCLECRKEVED